LVNTHKKVLLMTKDISQQPEVPDFLKRDPYHPESDPFIEQENNLKRAIVEQSEGMEPWQIETAKIYLDNKSIDQTRKIVKKRYDRVASFLKAGPAKQLVYLMELLRAHQDGPQENVRKHMLWRIANDNEKEDPKEATKAIAEINRMCAPKETGGPGGGINIIINNPVLERGPLDG